MIYYYFFLLLLRKQNFSVLNKILSMKGEIEKIRILETRVTNVLLSHLHFDRI